MKSGGKVQHDAAATAAERQRNGVAPQSGGGFWPSRFAPARGLAADLAVTLPLPLCRGVWPLIRPGAFFYAGASAGKGRCNGDTAGTDGFQNILLMRKLPENER